MRTLTIRNVDDKVVKKLKRKAKDNGRSLEAELRELLKQAANHGSRDEMLAEIDRIAAMTPKGARQTDSTKIIREFRDR